LIFVFPLSFTFMCFHVIVEKKLYRHKVKKKTKQNKK